MVEKVDGTALWSRSPIVIFDGRQVYLVDRGTDLSIVKEMDGTVLCVQTREITEQEPEPKQKSRKKQ